ncbi:MAG: hypothetical protein AAGJ18_15725 [Bacteroidota bacterium]
MKQQIAQKFFPHQLGLKKRDLEYLKTLIQQHSGISLSLSTLKRIWQKEVMHTPHPHTLDALVAVLGYESWQAFQLDHPVSKSRQLHPYKSLIWVVPLCMLVALTLYFLYEWWSPKTKSSPLEINRAIIFQTNKTVVEGVPNTVIFNYDVAQVKADSFFMQQSWNDQHKVKIDPTKKVFTSIYYTPSFHRAKLLANDSIIATQNVHILSKDWMAYVKYNMNDLQPIYLPKDNFGKTGQLTITSEELLNKGVDTTNNFYLRYCNIRNFGELTDENFTLKTNLKMRPMGQAVCPIMELMLVFERDIFWMTLTQQGCEYTVSYQLGEHYFAGKDNDLSYLGVNLQAWQNLVIKVENRNAEVLLNDEPIIRQNYQQHFG